MPGQAAVVGTSYYGRIDGVHTRAVLVTSNQNAQDGSRFYVLAVPAKDTEDRAHKIRDTQTGAQLWVKLVALDLLSGLKKNPYQRQTYADWGEGHPRLDDLQSLTRVPAALPLNMAGAVPHILLSEAEVDGTSDPAADTETEVGPAILNLFNPVNPEEPPARNETEAAPSPESAAVLAALNRIMQGQEALAARVGVLENVPPRGPSVPTGAQPGAFDDIDAELDRAAREAPLRARAEPTRPPPPPQAPGVTSGGQPSGEMAEWIRAMTAMVTAPPSRDPTPGISAAQAGLFKLHGAKGRVAQDELDRQFDADPGLVVKAFEDAVERRAGGLTTYANVGGRDGGGRVSDVLLQVWRETVPARESATIARVGEAVIDAYRQIRRGDPMRGAARLALLIGAMEQATLDNNRWQVRASTMLGMPPVPLHAYHALAPDAKKGQDSGKQLGEMARLADPIRATTALAVHKDAQPQA